MSSGVLEIIVSLNIIISHITSIIEEINRYLMSLSIRIYDLSSFLGLSLLVSLFFLRVVFISLKMVRLSKKSVVSPIPFLREGGQFWTLLTF